MANDFSKITIDGKTYNVKLPNNLTVGSKTFNGSEAVTIAASDLGLSNALHFIGETTTSLSDGSTTSNISVEGNTHTAASGDVVLYGAKEFVWQGSMWKELGDGSSHALKTISISAGGGLTGGGTLEANRTISHADTSSQESVSASGRRYITGVTLDGYGHVTGLTTGTETVTAPTVNNGTLTIQKNGTSVGEFTANQSGNTTANITVPTKTSELTNDSGFTTNTGTITGIKMNGSSKGTSGVVDLGTVITAHQDISGKLNKTTYEWNKEFAAGSNGAISLGRYNIYDTQLTFDISSTTSTSMSGKLVIATQNGTIQQAKVFGDATGALVSKIVIYQSAITNNRSWIEVFCNFNGWSKNKVHIYGVALNSATVTNQMSSVTFTNGVPSPITSGDTKWGGTIINDLSVKANLSGGNTFSGQQIFQNSNSGAVAECVMNNSAWDSFTVRNISDNTQKTAISNGYVWCQDSNAIYSRFNATSIYYGNDNNGSDCTLLFPEIASGESLEKTIATTDQIPTFSYDSTNKILTIS